MTVLLSARPSVPMQSVSVQALCCGTEESSMGINFNADSVSKGMCIPETDGQPGRRLFYLTLRHLFHQTLCGS